MKHKNQPEAPSLLSRLLSPLRIFRRRTETSDLKQTYAAHRATSLFAPTFKTRTWNR
jgi:hypothetical protein